MTWKDAIGRRTEGVVRWMVRIWIVFWVAFLGYFLLYFRTTGYGATELSLLPRILGFLFVLCLVMLAPALALLRSRPHPWRRYLVLCLAVGPGTFLVAEAHAGLEEYLFRRQCASMPVGSERVFQERWWPYGSSFLGYDPETGTFWGGD